MTRRMVTLPTCLLVPILVAAGFAASASASSLSSEAYPAVLKGEPTAQHVFTFEAGLTAKCPVATLRGELGESSTEIELEAEYHGTFEEKCTAFGLTATASISMNGCTYVLQPEAPTGADAFGGAVDIRCPEGQKITIVAGTCEVQIGEQGTTAEFLNDTKEKAHTDDVTYTLAENSVKYTKTKDGAGCPLSGTGEKTNGSLSGNTTVTGLDATGKSALDVYLFDLAPWTAQTYPTTLSGAQSGIQTFKFEGGAEGQKIECEVAVLDGELTGSALEVPMTVEYKGTPVGEEPKNCKARGIPNAGIVTMNGCNYRLRAIGEGEAGEFAGGVDLQCPPGSAVAIQWLSCKVQFGDESTPGNGVNQNLPITLVNNPNPEPETDDVELAFNIEEELFYEKTVDGIGCPFSGVGPSTTGTYTGSVTLSGASPETEAPHDIQVGP